MPGRRRSSDEEQPTRRRPAATPDARETQMIALADQLAEKQLREGTASSQVITHYLKLGSSRERIEQERLALELDLVKAKTEAIASQKRVEELFTEAIIAFRGYSGNEAPPPSDDEYAD